MAAEGRGVLFAVERWHYTYAGLRVTSELPIPEWVEFAQPTAFDDVDVCIVLDGAHLTPASADSEPAKVGTTADEHCFCIPEVGAYRVRHGREIVVMPAADAGSREVRLFLLGSAWGALCYQRGLLALHASVVQVGDQTIAICGGTSAGKSSVAAGLIARGYRFVGDDLCRFEVAGGMARVYPAAPRLKLWRDALEVLGQSAEGLERDHYRTDKFHLSPPTPFFPGREEGTPVDGRSVPLRAIYLLAWGEPGIARVTGMTALRRLVAAATYRGELLEPMGQTAAHWRRCAELAQHAPVYQLTRPRDWAAFDATMGMLIAHWQTIDTTERS